MNNVAAPTVNCLSLCSGIGGIELGLKRVVPEFRTVCYVEREIAAAAILVKNIQEGSLDDAPIWSDLATYDGKPWRGVVDIITSGFPCQPFSIAGKKRGISDERWIWEHIERTIRDVRPGLIFLENPPGILDNDGLGTILASLAQAGYNAKWDVFSAAETEAPHQRQRIYLLGYAKSARGWIFSKFRKWHSREAEVRYTNGHSSHASAKITSREDILAYTTKSGLAQSRQTAQRQLSTKAKLEVDDRLEQFSPANFPPHPTDTEGWTQVFREMPHLEPAVCRVANGIPYRVDRIAALGNAVVPAQAALAFSTLIAKINQSLPHPSLAE